MARVSFAASIINLNAPPGLGFVVYIGAQKCNLSDNYLAAIGRDCPDRGFTSPVADFIAPNGVCQLPNFALSYEVMKRFAHNALGIT